MTCLKASISTLDFSRYLLIIKKLLKLGRVKAEIPLILRLETVNILQFIA